MRTRRTGRRGRPWSCDRVVLICVSFATPRLRPAFERFQGRPATTCRSVDADCRDRRPRRRPDGRSPRRPSAPVPR